MDGQPPDPHRDVGRTGKELNKLSLNLVLGLNDHLYRYPEQLFLAVRCKYNKQLW